MKEADMMDRINIESAGIEFKNILSGPAPVGRILNYIKIAGSVGMYHRNGYRSLDFKGQVGSAWATEFMIGLNIFRLGAEVGDKFQLLLTQNGKKIFDIISSGNDVEFDEGVNDSSIDLVRKQMDLCSKELSMVYLRVFVSSIPFRVLKIFLDENGYVYPDRALFMDDLFESVKNLYDTDPTPYNRNARTTTGYNRVPSLLQLCKLFGLVEDTDNGLRFNKIKFEKISEGAISEYTVEQLHDAAQQAQLIIQDVDFLAEKYGIDGNVLAESIVRNSRLQHIFKYNLLISQHCRCVMCNITNKELLNGSHIKPASISNAAEKADYNNGLLLCCNHDRLFDRCLITFNFMDGQIEISKTLDEQDRTLLGLDLTYKLPKELLTPERSQYLMEHNMEFRNKEESR